MQLTLDSHDGAYTIQSSTEEGVIINHQFYPFPLMVTQKDLHQLSSEWTVSGLAPEKVALLLENEPEILLIGTGVHRQSLDPAILAFCYEKKIGVEIMSTASACRTFMLLQSERRNVALLLLLS